MLTDFPGKMPEERVLMVIRKHAIVYIRIIVFFFLSSVLPAIVFLYFWSGRFPLSSNSNMAIGGYLITSLYLLYSLALLLVAWLDEEFDLLILTDHRLIDVTQVTFLKRTVSTTPLNQIQDTTSKVDGIIGTIFNYGDIDVQTAAGNPDSFFMDHVHDPALAARQILNAAQEKKGQDYVAPPLEEN